MEEPISEPKEAPWSRDNASLADFDGYAGRHLKATLKLGRQESSGIKAPRRLFAQALDLV